MAASVLTETERANLLAEMLAERLAERDRARLTAATLANRLWQAERLLITVIQPGTSHAQDEETGRLINAFLANGGNHHD